MQNLRTHKILLLCHVCVFPIQCVSHPLNNKLSRQQIPEQHASSIAHILRVSFLVFFFSKKTNKHIATVITTECLLFDRDMLFPSPKQTQKNNDNKPEKN